MSYGEMVCWIIIADLQDKIFIVWYQRYIQRLTNSVDPLVSKCIVFYV